MPTITKRNDTYRITVSCGYNAQGKQVRRSTTWKPEPGMTKKQIERELQRRAVLFEEIARSGLVGDGAIKFEDFAEQWFKEYAQTNLKERTRDRWRQLTGRTYAAIGHIRIDRLKPRQVQEFINNLGENGINQKNGSKLSPKTIRHYLSFISSVLNYAVLMGMIPENPCRRVVLPKLNEKEIKCYSLSETQRLLELLEDAPIKYRTFIVLAIYGGFRRAELLGLEWGDIDFESHVINVRRSSLYTTGKGVFTDTPKTKMSSRSLKLPDSVFTLLRIHREEQAAEREKLGDKWKECGRLFTAWDGNPMHPNTPYEWLKRFCAAHDMRFLGLHAFRHLNASLMINSGIDIKTVSASLGHSQASTTMNIYAHTMAEAQARASEAIANQIQFGREKQA